MLRKILTPFIIMLGVFGMVKQFSINDSKEEESIFVESYFRFDSLTKLSYFIPANTSGQKDITIYTTTD